ncbi:MULTISPECIES: cytochrome b/b6 domain-containing protein [Hyphomicrobiales]|uniref:Cytochrome b/b6 domain-containing protein n=1 Tax=Bosea spartocytisi TaxID=2773451 RepID=A0A927E8K2_9HYPH|nr:MULTISPECIES: cytochrome b/b6 domain-containing protein [Hyphomicrobiales]MBN9034099.1 cytochrome b/b6 domain-containing protein [Hyphomicrobiales bacterium]OJU67687.1 MAG: cytochrome B [Rhizobiales bacterium 63-7]KIU53437.1 cytochrome B561 [Bradyrhizobium elkanii]MBD3846294.1 cytochrome b/b6 domain-containing protein [Bosea spartocytisi]MCT4473476.1 cytochrome b/b6 domain-containing protein [Bosea spartocytisi]
MTSEVSRAVAPPRGQDAVCVWDPLVRIFHWTVVLGTALNYFVLASGKPPHRYVGYGIAAALAVRVVWGFVGSTHARFSDFVTSPRAVLLHLAAVKARRDRRYVGHNPAGGAMVLVLMTLIALTCLTGWMQGLDAFWGVEWLQEVHALCANLIIAMAAIHVFAAIMESVLHRENLILAMITGRKRRASGTDIDHAGTAGGG